MRCAAITRAGRRCKLEATVGSYCYSHSPETADQRHRAARRGGKAGGNGRGGGREVQDLKQRISNVIDAVLDGSQDRGRGAVAIQGFNSLRGVLELERKVKEVEELESRLQRLEQASESGATKGGRKWGA